MVLDASVTGRLDSGFSITLVFIYPMLHKQVGMCQNPVSSFATKLALGIQSFVGGMYAVNPEVKKSETEP